MEEPTTFAFKISVVDLLEAVHRGNKTPGSFLGDLLVAFIDDSVANGSIDKGITGYLENNPDATHFITSLSFAVWNENENERKEA